jgi:uncharacterized repeat protein (TIGR01451 family)
MNMKMIIRFILLATSLMALLACKPSSPLKLTKTANTTTYSQIGQTIIYTFSITNTGTANVGPTQFTITDERLGETLNCGPADTTLAPSQSVTCAGTYTITQADMQQTNLGNSATASGDGVPASPPATFAITNLTPP